MVRLLTNRFGPLPEDVLQRLADASKDDLETWADCILETDSLEAVFKRH